MESLLFTLDVLYIIVLAFAVFRHERGRSADLGFFAFKDQAGKAPGKTVRGREGRRA